MRVFQELAILDASEQGPLADLGEQVATWSELNTKEQEDTYGHNVRDALMQCCWQLYKLGMEVYDSRMDLRDF